MKLSQLYWRIYQDFLMGNRLSEYRDLLTEAQERGYVFLTVSELVSVARGLKLKPRLALVLRQDIDSDVSTARAMFEIERRLGIKATYYFRLSTLDAKLMHEMQEHGTEIGYHFEEVATVAKRLGLRNPADVKLHLDLIHAEFHENLERFRRTSGILPRTVASHGDFANRMLRLTNSWIIDENIRKEYQIIAEAYDEWLNAPVTLRLSDKDAPRWWSPIPFSQALAQEEACLYVLVHPRQWRASPRENLKAEVSRIVEGALFSFSRMVNHRRRRIRRQSQPLDTTVQRRTRFTH